MAQIYKIYIYASSYLHTVTLWEPCTCEVSSDRCTHTHAHTHARAHTPTLLWNVSSLATKNIGSHIPMTWGGGAEGVQVPSLWMDAAW